MVFFALYVGAELDGLTNLQPGRGCDDPNFAYYLKLLCENCGEVTTKDTYVTLSETVEVPKGRSAANLVQKGIKMMISMSKGTLRLFVKYLKA